MCCPNRFRRSRSSGYLIDESQWRCMPQGIILLRSGLQDASHYGRRNRTHVYSAIFVSTSFLGIGALGGACTLPGTLPDRRAPKRVRKRLWSSPVLSASIRAEAKHRARPGRILAFTSRRGKQNRM